jgi:hypothetical protein
MFDRKQEIALKIPSEEGVKEVAVRYPTDDEIIDWRRKKKVVQRGLGRGLFQMEQSKPEQIDVKLAASIRVDEGGPDIDDAESVFIINKLLECEVTERPEREGSALRITMKVLGKLKTVHTLRKPSVKEMLEYQRFRSQVTFGNYNVQEIRINLSAGGDLYDKLKIKVEGYAGNDVPVPHKAEAVNVLIQEVQGEEENVIDPDEDDDGPN